MNKIQNLFQGNKNNILSIYFTAGFPSLNDTATIIKELENSGVDLIEVGIPFSDPLADGPVIQHSSERALNNGMTVKVLFEQLKKVKTNVPLILMGYLNPILQFGVAEFCKESSALGVSGLIIPDLPVQQYLDEYKRIFDKYNLLNVFLITPQTSEERVLFIDEHSIGFIYMVSSSSTTGVKNGIDAAQQNYFERIKNMKLRNPRMIGFGISDKATFAKATESAQGAIIGSAFIKAISKQGDLKKQISEFVQSVR